MIFSPQVSPSLVAGGRRIDGLKIRPPSALKVKFDPLDFELALVPSIKVVPGIVVIMPVKFGDHRIWSDRAARGSASNLPSRGFWVCQLIFVIVNMLE